VYLESLPERFDTPAYFNEGELEVLRGTNLGFAWKDRVDIWRREYNDVKVVIPGVEWYFRCVRVLIQG
jgi:hypothetical protein